jgi:hypothetical protein
MILLSGASARVTKGEDDACLRQFAREDDNVTRCETSTASWALRSTAIVIGAASRLACLACSK